MPKKSKPPVCFGYYHMSGSYVDQCNICECKVECKQAEQQAFVKRLMQRMGREYKEPETDN